MADVKNALIVGVGASRGVGAATARCFAREQFQVFVAGRSAAKIDAVVAEMRAAGHEVQRLVGDASLEADAIRFVDAVKGPLAFVLYNAGSNRRDAFIDLEAAAFEQIWREHCLGGFLIGRRRRVAWCPRGSAQSCLPARRHRCAAARGMRPSPPPRPDCGPLAKAWPVSSHPKGSRGPRRH